MSWFSKWIDRRKEKWERKAKKAATAIVMGLDIPFEYKRVVLDALEKMQL